MLLLCALVVGSSAWADSYSYTFNASSGISKGENTLNSVIWNIDHNSGYENNEATGYHVGSSSKSISYLELSTSGISGIISKIVVRAKGNGSGGTIGASVNNTAYTAKNNNNAITNSFQDFEFTGDSEGEIVIRLAYSSSQTKNFYIASIEVTYSLVTKHTLSSMVSPASTGTILLGATTIAEGNTTTISATPNEGYRFVDWSVSGTGSSVESTTSSSTTFTMGTTDATVTANFEAIPTHTLSYTVSPAGAGNVVLGSTSVMEGFSSTATASANSGYKFTGWSITGTGAELSSTTDNPTTITMGTANATVTASFAAVKTYEINWSVNGSIVKTENVEENTAIDLGAPASDVPGGYTFMGWVEEANKIDTPTDTDPSANYITSATSTANITYYAVLAKVVDYTLASWSETTLSAMTSSDIFVITDGSNYAMNNNNGTTNAPSTNAVTIADGKITSEVADELKWNVTGNDTDGYIFYLNGDNTNWLYCNTNASSGSNNNIRVGTGNRKFWKINDNGYLVTSDDYTTRYMSIYNNSDFRGYVNTSNGAFKPKFYKYIAPVAIYGGYCTTVTATISLNAACNDGAGKFYGTYSNSAAFVVPEDITVSSVGVSDGKLVVTDYSAGEVVKANTGVMVSATSAGNKTIVLTSATGVEKDGNMLKASGDAGMTAEQMNLSSTKFYRLTMHNGTDLGFYWGAADGAAFAIGANKAYLAVPTSLAREGFWFEDEAASVEEKVSVNGEESAAAVYDLQGRRVAQPTKGLYIVNGKKVIVK